MSTNIYSFSGIYGYADKKSYTWIYSYPNIQVYKDTWLYGYPDIWLPRYSGYPDKHLYMDIMLYRYTVIQGYMATHICRYTGIYGYPDIQGYNSVFAYYSLRN